MKRPDYPTDRTTVHNVCERWPEVYPSVRAACAAFDEEAKERGKRKGKT